MKRLFPKLKTWKFNEEEKITIEWVRELIIKSFLTILIVATFLITIIIYLNEETFSFFSLIVFLIALISFILLKLGKYNLSSYILILGLNFMFIFRGLEIFSAYMFTFLSLILIISGILTKTPLFSILLFLIDIIGITIGIITEKFTWGQPIDPDSGVYYANTLTDLIPNILVAFIISMILHYIINALIKKQQEQFEILKQTQKKLIDQEKLISLQTLAGGIAHDFNNLLTSILGVLSLLNTDFINDFEIPADTKLLIEEAEKASIRAKLLTTQLQNFSKSHQPKIENIQNFEELIKDVVRFSSRGSNIKPKIHIQENLYGIKGDKSQISQVIQNLVINAIQAMQEGGHLDIYLENSTCSRGNEFNLQPGDYLKIIFQDTGVGISENKLKSVFEAFFTTKKEGTGLGLYISKMIVLNHLGYIEVKSQVGQGTKFMVILPAIPGTSKNEIVPDKKIPNFSGKRILIMDDDVAILRTLEQMLKKISFTVDMSKTGSEACDKYEKSYKIGKPYDLLILDCTIPGGIGGQECTTILQKINPNVKIILSSGYEIPEIKERNDYEIMVFFLHKPYTIIDLASTLSMALNPNQCN
ncbi:ATP-binding protein [Promethearchaeum syntrophicum]|uniref:ATP-binding protein n=1 Tax=Promethearchaeum syntrophicum TaxID=2594042 RepID=A0A5B9DF38_9ARCH|nr:ATP-binding protein [Candidatus Prometheoarchaeum syntrophicum]QEE17403.1 sensory histidine kinase AtoS [Candidatus Prometheoarchaeum syntrophicum]